jgi:cyclopropane fatty-acyl-phospholipid synthase-like methyltransferase
VGPGSTVVELGGANSCFLDAIAARAQPGEYHVVDNNRFGLDLLRERARAGSSVAVHEADVTALDLDVRGDVVFSVGLIEHFSPAVTREVIDAHFDLAKPGGYVILSYPTPTFLYRAARRVAEWAGLWKFPDERPLEAGEVREAAGRKGESLSEEVLWPIVFTQRMVLVRKRLTGAGRKGAAG